MGVLFPTGVSCAALTPVAADLLPLLLPLLGEGGAGCITATAAPLPAA